MRGWVVWLLLAPAVAGCLADGPSTDDDAGPTEPTATGSVVQFGPGVLAGSAARTSNLSASVSLTGFQGGEPTIGVLSSGAIFVQAWDDTIRSKDGGQNWESVYEFRLLGQDFPDPVFDRSEDPMLWVDRSTQRVYWNHLAGYQSCTAIGWSEDEGETWERNDLACGTPTNVDFQKLGGGPPGPDSNPLAGAAHPTVVYLCYNKPNAGAFCAVSYDGGETWPIEARVAGCAGASGTYLGACGSVSWRVAVAPDGTAYAPLNSMIGVSTDSGLTWGLIGPPDPGDRSFFSVNDLAFTPDGTMYALGYTDAAFHLARSDDAGATWDGPWRVAPPGVDVNVFPALAAGDDGRVGVAFVGTEDNVDDWNEAPDDTRWDLYMVLSEDAARNNPTFTSVRATDDPVQVGSICLGRAGGCGGADHRNLLDFIDATVAPDGTFYVAFTDGCTDACATNADPEPEDSRDSATAVAWLEGWSLKEVST